ncbi:hypothetical protein EG68_06555 [Paragonimus skrjabini miyazakii]|uniref:Uncharacterized protein n=1 Tax=Paragonimus skrjabini miyazakii TaxID=59628 RepID=A0A8S9YQ17_9TREM|nr:hypothetical protein EG68_06555 [Paragonimus skrjabini miyazakii]
MMRTHVLIFCLVFLILGNHQTEAISTADLQKKLQEIFGDKITADQVKQIATTLNENVPASVKNAFIDQISKQMKLPDDVVSTLRGLVGGTGFHQTGSIILLTAFAMLHLLVV